MEGGPLAKSDTEEAQERRDRGVFATKYRVKRADSDDPTVTMWEFLHGDRWTMPSEEGLPGLDVTVPLRKPPKYEVLLPQIMEMAEAGSGVDLISRALGIGASVVRYAHPLYRTGKQPSGDVDGWRRHPRQPLKPLAPKYQQISPEVDRRRKAGEGFDRLARKMIVSRPTIIRAYGFANRGEAAAEVPDSARRSANAICSSVKCFAPIKTTCTLP